MVGSLRNRLKDFACAPTNLKPPSAKQPLTAAIESELHQRRKPTRRSALHCHRNDVPKWLAQNVRPANGDRLEELLIRRRRTLRKLNIR